MSNTCACTCLYRSVQCYIFWRDVRNENRRRKSGGGKMGRNIGLVGGGGEKGHTSTGPAARETFVIIIGRPWPSPGAPRVWRESLKCAINEKLNTPIDRVGGANDVNYRVTAIDLRLSRFKTWSKRMPCRTPTIVRQSLNSCNLHCLYHESGIQPFRPSMKNVTFRER